ncbi:hypothetical protein PMI19_04137 [Pseudomonas sp. GM16]|jgi:hypothetical protein|nr:hypothetical protein PMI19_04137 [Pseudomonas sp. GM16]
MRRQHLEQEADFYGTSRKLSSLDEWHLSVRYTPVQHLVLGGVA